MSSFPTHHHRRPRVESLRRSFLQTTTTLLLQVLFFSSTFTTTTAQTTTPHFHLRINAGGPLIIDNNNNNNYRWESDTAYNVDGKGSRRNVCSSSSINNTTFFTNLPLDTPASVFCTQRYYNPQNIIAYRPPYQYQIPVPDNDAYYVVILHVVELVRFSPFVRSWVVLMAVHVTIVVAVVAVLSMTSPLPISNSMIELRLLLHLILILFLFCTFLSLSLLGSQYDSASRHGFYH